ncbi:MAG: p-aminobenzoyl-glutamate transporter AbgT [Pseudohongiellaceae bacterium]|jgi:p-aminobenzoyl-glutamate transporter AbgT
MWLKVVIIILLITLFISLFTGFGFLVKDQGAKRKDGLWNSISVRLAIAVLLMAFTTYGVLTGQLTSQAPWGKGPTPQNIQPKAE